MSAVTILRCAFHVYLHAGGGCALSRKFIQKPHFFLLNSSHKTCRETPYSRDRIHETKNQKLTFAEKTGYAFGDAASNLFWMTFIYFQSKFYTDVFFYTPDAELERSLLQKLAALLLLTRVS